MSKCSLTRTISSIESLCHHSGWFGSSELKAFDPASAEKAKSSLRQGNALCTALGEALDPSLIPARTNVKDGDEDDDEDEEENDNPAPVRKKGATRTKKSAKTESSDKKRRVSVSEGPAAKRKPPKRSIPAEVEDEEDESPKVSCL